MQMRKWSETYEKDQVSGAKTTTKKKEINRDNLN